MRSLRLARQLILEDGWSPPWLYVASPGWCIHDALTQVSSPDGVGIVEAFDGYIEAVKALTAELGVDVMLWEREPHRVEDDVVGLFERVLAANVA